jgi:N-acetylglucosaminyl-diphospho-decaprenol L-rhamnosyltransferase
MKRTVVSPDNETEHGQASVCDLAVVIVLHNSADVIDQCLEAVPAQAQVIIVDNASVDDGLELARAHRPDAIVVRSERNVGFGAGCNLGWHSATRLYVAFVNPDVRLGDRTLPLLLARLSNERHTIVGPALLDASGRPRRCKRQPSALLDICGLLPAAARWAPTGWDGKLAQADPIQVRGGRAGSIEGAAFVVRRADLEAIGGFDEDFFLYYEEDSLAARLARLGGGAFYEPCAVAEHMGGHSTRKVAALAKHHLHRSRVIFYRKRHGDLRGILIGVVLVLAALLSGAAVVVNVIVGREPSTTLSDVGHTLGGLFAGMTATLSGEPSHRLG